MNDALERKLLARIRVGDGCWEWVGPRAHGYGQFSFAGRTRRTHRVSWELYRGPIPDGMLVCHDCDNRACVRPAHLFLGTPADNMRDRDTKDRHARGSRQHCAKLTDDDVRAIHTALVAGSNQADLARRYQVSHSTIVEIRRGTTWMHLGLRPLPSPGTFKGDEWRKRHAHRIGPGSRGPYRRR